MAKSDKREKAANWYFKKEVKEVLGKATPEEYNKLRELNLAMVAGFNRYEPATAFRLKQEFWQDCSIDGIIPALEKWEWLRN